MRVEIHPYEVLLAALWAGLMRLGWQLPALTPSLALAHGPLMISGFLGTLITLERAVAMQKKWMYIPPLLSGLGWLVTLAADLSLKTVEARFAKLLLDSVEGDVIERRRWTTQTEMASHLGTVPDVLSRVIRELTKAGLIEVDKQHIRILDRAGLAGRTMIRGG